MGKEGRDGLTYGGNGRVGEEEMGGWGGGEVVGSESVAYAYTCTVCLWPIHSYNIAPNFTDIWGKKFICMRVFFCFSLCFFLVWYHRHLRFNLQVKQEELHQSLVVALHS